MLLGCFELGRKMNMMRRLKSIASGRTSVSDHVIFDFVSVFFFGLNFELLFCFDLRLVLNLLKKWG